jgi:dTMP kinase
MARPAPRLVSLEGISGVGKTYLAGKVKEALAVERMTLVREASNRLSQTSPQLDVLILSVLGQSGDLFFRNGSPLCETFLLLALKMYDYEAMIVGALADGRIVFEDRSIDSIAVYQAALLCDDQPERVLAVANAIYDVAAQWRKPPDLTFLVEDDFETAIGRAETRSARPFKADELVLLKRAAETYAMYAEQHKDRIVRLDRRRLDEHEVVSAVIERL